MIPVRGFVIFLVVCFFAVGVFKRSRDRQETRRALNPESESERGPETARDLNDEFFENAQGKIPIPFIRIYSNQDKMIIRSLLDSAGIRNYQGMHHFGDLLPGVRVQGYTDTILYIYESDREEAEELVIDYIRNQVENLTGRQVSTKQALVDAIALLNAKPTGLNQILPEFIKEPDHNE